MTYEEERHARDLHRALSQELSGLVDASVSVEGAGVHWTCTAGRGDRSCPVSCFDSGGPEYLTSFRRDGETASWGRTQDQEELVAAVADWLGGDGVGDLHARYQFVDREKRALSSLASELVRSQPALAESAEFEVRHGLCDLHELWFMASDRSCRVSYYGKNAFFHWDSCTQFQFPADDTALLGEVLKRWLCDRAMPSALAADYSWLQLEPIARYYEDGLPVEGEFILSWDSIEHFYQCQKLPFAGAVLAFLSAARQAGYDRLLRAGQSLWTLVLSRSRRHGLRNDQPSVAVNFRADGMDVHVHIGGRERHSFPAVAFTPQVDALLRRLAAQPID